MFDLVIFHGLCQYGSWIFCLDGAKKGPAGSFFNIIRQWEETYLNLSKLGVNYISHRLKDMKESGLVLGRVALPHKRLYRVFTGQGEWLAEISGRLRFEAETSGDFPAVGDWVYMRPREDEKRRHCSPL